MKLKHIVIALSLILATVPAVAFAQGGDGQDAGSTNARIHIVVFGATGDAPPCTCVRHHIVIFGREEASRDAGTAGRQPDGGIVQQAVGRLASRVSANVVRSAVAAAFRLAL